MSEIKGTKTEKNLLKSFAGESQAKMRYTLFAEKAQEEGYEQIAELFKETGINEKEHANIFFSFLYWRRRSLLLLLFLIPGPWVGFRCLKKELSL